MTTSDSEADETDQAKTSPQREKWFVVAFVFQFTFLCFAAPVVLIFHSPHNHHAADIVVHWLLIIVGTPLFWYVGFRLMLAGFSYMVCSWAGEVPPARMDLGRQWHAIAIGMIFLSQPLFFWPQNKPVPIIVTCFETLAGLLLILWAVDERRRTRSEAHINSDDDAGNRDD